MKFKLIICSLLVGLITLSFCLAGEQNKALSESEMQAAIGRSDCCDDVIEVSCGDPGDGCRDCDESQGALNECYASAPSYFDESYHYCYGDSAAKECVQLDDVKCAEYYNCIDAPVHNYRCKRDEFYPYDVCTRSASSPWKCRTCERAGEGKQEYIEHDDYECRPL